MSPNKIKNLTHKIITLIACKICLQKYLIKTWPMKYLTKISIINLFNKAIKYLKNKISWKKAKNMTQIKLLKCLNKIKMNKKKSKIKKTIRLNLGKKIKILI